MTLSRGARVVAAACALLFVVLAGLAIVRTQLWTYGADTGTFAQIVLDAFGGMRNGVEHGTHFRFHWSPSLALLWPLLAATHATLTLQLVQAVATAATPFLLYALIRPYASGRLAAGLGILAALYPPLLAVGFSEFHDLGLFPPLALALVLAADRRAWGAYAVVALIVLGLREDLCVEAVVLGAGLAFAGTPAGRSRATAIAGGATALAALATLGLYYGLVIPRLGGWAPAHFYAYPFAAGPLAVAREILTAGRLTYVIEALAPLAFVLPFRSRWSWAALPGIAIVLLANNAGVWRMGMHYAALWGPWLLIGSAFGAAAIARRSERLAAVWLRSALALSILILIVFNPMHPAHYLRANYHDLGAARAALACAPATATLATHDEWYTAVATRRPLATLATVDGPEWLVYADDFPNAEFAAQALPALRAGVAAGRYRIACTFGAVHAYQRTATRDHPPEEHP